MTHVERIRKSRYGLSPERWARLLAIQDHRCAVCGILLAALSSKSINVDHDHACCPDTRAGSRTCGRCVRGIVCGRCNRRIAAYERGTLGKGTSGYETIQLIKRYLARPPARRLSGRTVQIRAS